ncbi:hypothetical protein Pcinc_043092 [Petrolisthes cinctipes]|uniref:Uncharacterized protein n=1 Tax=Petrolisthes cinctipes TaxID=88211 RepID=A0AAE1EFB8_PETCI|nr:hypothetical protein Pcinc_043092 [Petrolisthes cinctipes]
MGEGQDWVRGDSHHAFYQPRPSLQDLTPGAPSTSRLWSLTKQGITPLYYQSLYLYRRGTSIQGTCLHHHHHHDFLHHYSTSSTTTTTSTTLTSSITTPLPPSLLHFLNLHHHQVYHPDFLYHYSTSSTTTMTSSITTPLPPPPLPSLPP